MTARRTLVVLGVLALLLPAAALARPSGGKGRHKNLPQTIALPDGWQPEGIAAGRGRSLFVGSIPTGAVWAGDARTGQGAVRVPAHSGRSAIGIKIDYRNRIFVAGGATGQAYVYDAKTGADLASYQLAPSGQATFVNDVVVTSRAAWFTDSRLQQLYVVPLGRRGALPPQSAVRTLPLTGDIVYEAGNNANGIVVADGKYLIIVQTNTGRLFRVSRRTGRTRAIDLGGALVTNGDGLLLKGRTLYVVRNRDNQIAVVQLGRHLRTGRVKRTLTDPDFDVPTTLASQVGALWAVNARFGTPPGPDVPYSIVRVG